MKLLLTSNGINGKIKDAFVRLLPKEPKATKVAFVTTAVYGEEDWDSSNWLEERRQEVRDCGVDNIEDIDIRDMTREDIEKLLNEKDVLYVAGGNTFFLLYYVRQCGLQEALTKFFLDGKVYAGISAGSIICAPTIETAVYSPSDLNTIGLTDLTGFSYVPFLLSPHFNDANREILEEESKEAVLPMVVLTDLQAVMVRDDVVKLVGEGEQVLLKNPSIFPLAK